MSALNTFVTENWKWILGLFVYIMIGYATFTDVQDTTETTKRRLQNYINVIKDMQGEINELKIDVAVLEAHQKCEK